MAKPLTLTPDLVPMVLDWRKTQTRRPVLPPDNRPGWELELQGPRSPYHRWVRWKTFEELECITDHPLEWSDLVKPIYEIGDILYIAEPWNCVWSDMVHMPCEAIRAAVDTGERKIVYEADGIYVMGQWLSAKIMPKWAARLKRYKVIRVWKENLQDISAADASLEGCPLTCTGDLYETADMILDWFRQTWDSVYGGKPGKRWDDNPVVYAYEWREVANPAL